MASTVETDSPPMQRVGHRSGFAMITAVRRSLVVLGLLASLGGCGETVLSPIGPVAVRVMVLLPAVV